MEQKINIAELLKDCPSGMELDCLMYDNLYLDQICDDDDYKIYCYTIVDEIRTAVYFTEYGTFDRHKNSKCVIFPKGKTTWEGFKPPCKFKDGDVIYVEGFRKWVAIFKSFDGDAIYEHVALNNEAILHFSNNIPLLRFADNPTKIRYATEEEKAKLFQAIKDNGYKWNAETKTLEKLTKPKFKVSDTIQNEDGYKVKITEVNVADECYGYESIIAKGIGGIPFKEQNNWELVPSKFDINTLKPFDNCKYSLDGGRTWKFAQYWYIKDKYDVNEIEIDLWLN